MSIPPLVCSTPPPPDQCEDDKDHDDYEYNLSQEEDENNDYDFGNYPTFNHFQSLGVTLNIVKDEENQEIKVTPDKVSVNSEKETEECDTVLDTKDTSECKLGHEDDFDIEDLDLKIDSESSGSSVKDNSSVDEISKHENPIGVTSGHIPNLSSVESQYDNSCLPISNSQTESFEHIEGQTSKLERIETNNFQEETNDIHKTENTTIQNVLEVTGENEVVCSNLGEPSNILEDATDDDFGDFDEFQFIAPEGNPNNSLYSNKNPWEDKVPDDSEFGQFTANFDNNEMIPQNAVLEVVSDKSSSYQNNPDVLNDDSFGDFEDFQSSATQNETKDAPEEGFCDSVPVLNLQSIENETQILESINKVLSSLFEEEISEPMDEDEIKLESMLSETWGHLTETDVRQPYIINWNSSLGQKTLLRALCIDSRNILFGPKWSHNMPKYAANLTSAPLQPQKQLSSTSHPEVTISEKTTSKPNNWSDPFSANGQESCNTQNENNVIQPRPTDLDVFEAAISTKPDKIYSSVLNVQPIRQINLPDTHIFTPTDSETPRSKTIHYDNNPNGLLHQDIADKHENQVQAPQSQSSYDKPNKVDDDDYLEFQEFRTTPKMNTLPEINNQTGQSIVKHDEIVSIMNPLPKPSIAYQTQLLQPIKIEPAIPTLNWPDPGEVKEEFNDFSDFTSTSSWVDKSSSNPQLESIKANSVHSNITHESSNIQETIPEKEIIHASNENSLDEDFDTFKSAVPPVNKKVDFSTDGLNNELGNNSMASNIIQSGFEHSFLKDSNFKTDNVSFENIVKSNESTSHTLGLVMNITEPTNKNTPTMGTQLPMNLLQPMPASSTTTLTSNQQKSGQILQPLSLESYSQINWPSPGIDLQDLSRFNPVETLHSLKSDLSASAQSKGSPIQTNKPAVNNIVQEDDVWGEFVSSKPTPQLLQTKKQTTFGDDDEWTDFVSSPSVKPHNGLNTISLNVHTNSNIQKIQNQSKYIIKSNQISLDIPTLNYITPKTNNHKSNNDRHFQNL
ncbi:uncharacterized protein LOC115443439 isoform X1 [Manduca sexta]|uniref:uncharacterized protein LOC115443439 isoform X1 n=1 Tax=Manduca sexta TaxID=7130 RepID=UPI00188EBF68|nr:uncharacterized protein LOC115443439 isoform X1 [Manduca sexta]